MRSDRSSSETGNDVDEVTATPRQRWPLKPVGLVALVASVGSLLWIYRDVWRLETLARHEAWLKEQWAASPMLFYVGTFAADVVVIGLSLPVATGMTLVIGWFFGFWRGLILVSFASTTGATCAFLLSRFFFRDWVQRRFGERARSFQEHLDREGAFYLFSLRLIPLVPFFVINLVMGLTRLRVWTFWWVSQVGMLGGTAVYVWAGSQIPDLQTLADEGIQAVLRWDQLLRITIAFTLLGLFPWLARGLLGVWRKRRADTQAELR